MARDTRGGELISNRNNWISTGRSHEAHRYICASSSWPLAISSVLDHHRDPGLPEASTIRTAKRPKQTASVAALFTQVKQDKTVCKITTGKSNNPPCIQTDRSSVTLLISAGCGLSCGGLPPQRDFRACVISPDWSAACGSRVFCVCSKFPSVFALM